MIKKGILLLSILLLTSVVFTACFGDDIFNLSIRIEDEDQNPLTADSIIVSNDEYEETFEEESALEEDVPEGAYTIVVEKDGYKSVTERIELDDDTTVTIPLEKIEEKDLPKESNLTVKVSDDILADIEIIGDEYQDSWSDKSEVSVEVPHDSYKIIANAEGYKEKTKEVVVENDKEVILELEEELGSYNLAVNLIDENQRSLSGLDSEVELLKDDEVIKEEVGFEFLFEDLKEWEYEIRVTAPEGYKDTVENITLEEDLEVDIEVPGGPVKQIYFEEEIDRDKLVIDGLSPGDEIIIAAAYLNPDFTPEFNLDYEADRLAKIEYDVRQRGVELAKEYGNDFADLEVSDYEVGDTKEFIVDSDIKETTFNATVEGVGENLAVFVDDSDTVSQTDIDNLISEFDEIIAPMIEDDGINGKVSVLLTDFNDYQVTGYFDPVDLYSEAGNEERVLYLNSDRELNTILSAAARQYQHLAFYKTKVEAERTASDAWIDEGLAQVVQVFSGYVDYEKTGWTQDGGSGWLYDEEYGFLNNTEKVNLLTHDGSLAFSGASSLFSSYLFEQFGGDFVESVMESSEDPVTAIEDKAGYEFMNIYLSWVTTNVTDDFDTIMNDVYNYSSFDLQKSPKFSEDELIGSGIQYYLLESEGEEIEFDLPTEIDGKLGIVIIKK